MKVNLAKKLRHDGTDDVFLVLAGRLTIELRGHDDVELGPGEPLVVPGGSRPRRARAPARRPPRRRR